MCLRSEGRRSKSRGSHAGQSLTKVLPKVPMKYYLSQAAVQYLMMCVRHCLPASLLDCTAHSPQLASLYWIGNSKAWLSLLHGQLPSPWTQRCSHSPHTPSSTQAITHLNPSALECLGMHSGPLHAGKTKVCLMHMYVPNRE